MSNNNQNGTQQRKKKCRNRANSIDERKMSIKNLCNRTHSHTPDQNPIKWQTISVVSSQFCRFSHFTIRFFLLQFVYFYFGCSLRSLVRTLLQTPDSTHIQASHSASVTEHQHRHAFGMQHI